jgi:hypothetical protein
MMTQIGRYDCTDENRMEEEPLTRRLIGCCFKVHRELGPGFSEKIYHAALKVEFRPMGLRFETGKIPVVFEYQLLSYLRASHLRIGLPVNSGNKSCQVRRLLY